MQGAGQKWESKGDLTMWQEVAQLLGTQMVQGHLSTECFVKWFIPILL